MSQKINRISTQELINFNQDRLGFIIDVRPVDAYNGWKLRNESRGGHIRHAKSLPVKWTNYIDWIEIVRSKGIMPENQVVIYGYTDKEAEQFAQFFLRAGYTDLSVYNHFVDNIKMVIICQNMLIMNPCRSRNQRIHNTNIASCPH